MNKWADDKYIKANLDDFYLFRLVCPHYDEFQGEVAKAITGHYTSRPFPVLKTLEIGTGTGNTTLHLLANNQSIWIDSLDINPDALEIAKRNLEKLDENCIDPHMANLDAGISNRAKLTCADALDQLKELEDESYHAVVSAYTLHNFGREYRSEVHKEIFRVLKPGGVFVNGDKYMLFDENQHKEDLGWQMRQYFIFLNLGRPDLYDVYVDHTIKDENPDMIMRIEEIYEEFRQIGFVYAKIAYHKHMEAVVVAEK